MVEGGGPTAVTFFLADSRDDPESLSHAEESQQRSCQIQTPVEVHSPMGPGFEESCGADSVLTLDAEDTAAQTVAQADTEADQPGEKCVDSVVILDFKSGDAGSQEDVLEDVCSERQVLENHVTSEVNGLEQVDHTEGHAADVSCPEEFNNSDGQEEPDSEKSDESESIEPESEIHEETHNVHSVPEVESVGDDTVQQTDQKQAEPEADLAGTKDESDEDSHSLPSSNDESIVKVSDEESACDETEDSIQPANGFVKTSPEEDARSSDVEASSRNIMDLQVNGCPVEKEDEDLHYRTDISDLSKSLDLNSTVTGGDLTENSDFSIIDTSYTPELADGKCTEQETLSLLSFDASEETHEVEVR